MVSHNCHVTHYQQDLTFAGDDDLSWSGADHEVL